MHLASGDQAALEGLLDSIKSACTGRWISIVLCGEAASAAYRPGVSPLSLAVVVDRVDFSILEALRPVVARAGRRLSTPLLFDPPYIASALDVFPLEFLDLVDRHRLLEGTSDPFAALEIGASHVKTQLEEQLRGKMLHLRETYLEEGPSRRLGTTLLDSLSYFYVLLRGLLFLDGHSRSGQPLELLAAVESVHDVSLRTVAELEAVRVGDGRLSASAAREHFAGYLACICRLVEIVDTR